MAINNNLNLKKELEEKNEQYDHSDGFLGKDVLTFANRINSSRGIMFGSHLDQYVVLAEPEFPRVFTNYENQVGSYSSSYKQAKKEWTVVKRINKFKFNPNVNYLLVVKDDENNYDIIQRRIGERLTEHYCYVNNNSVIDNKKEGDIIKEGEVLYHSTSFDDDLVFRYGTNANAVYLIENNTIEDAIVVSESLAKKLDSFYLDEIEVNINTNDILCNLYGDTNNYKSFPDIGENTNDKILTARRRVNYDTALFDLKSENLRKIINNLDTVFYADGQLVDIEIFSNQPLEELKVNTFNDQLVKYIEGQDMYHMQIINVLKPIVENPENHCSTELTYLYRRAKDFLDENTVFTDKTEFDGMIAKFTVLKRNHLHIGTKLTGRFGNKGVVSEIRPDDEMPKNQYGEHAEIIFNALGVCNRLNPSQLYEVELNFFADNVQRLVKKEKTYKGKLRLILDFVNDINPEQCKQMKEYIKTLTKEGLKDFINETQEEGFYLCQPPFWNNIDFDQLSALYDKWQFEPYECTINGKPIQHKLIFGKEYILKLKHEASGKFSARSSAFINLKGSPSKSMSFKKNQDLYSSTPIRLGEMEVQNMLLTQTDDIVKLISMYSSSEVNRKSMIEQLLIEDVLDLEEIELEDDHDNHNRKILDVYMKSLGCVLEDE